MTEMPDEIYAGMLSTGSTYYTSHKMAADIHGCKHAKGMEPMKYIRSDLVKARSNTSAEAPAAYWARYNDGSGEIFEDKDRADSYAKRAYTECHVIPVYTGAGIACMEEQGIDFQELANDVAERRSMYAQDVLDVFDDLKDNGYRIVKA